MSIAEAKEQIHRKMAQQFEWQIMEFHQLFDAFKLRVPAWPAPIADLTTLDVVVHSLRAQLDTILEARVPEFKAPSTEAVEDTMLVALFSTTVVPPPPARDHSKRQRVKDVDESWERNKERIELEDPRRSSLFMKRPAS